MISQLEIDKRNLESSLIFMQQEHSSTLKALHEEISKLQKRCKDMTFELTMQDYATSETDNQDTAAKVEELSNVVKDNESKYQQLEHQLDTKDKTIDKLKSQLRKNERNSKEELKKKDQQVLTLKVELDAKSGNIAYLTTEMHKYKVLRHSSNIGSVELPQSPPTTDMRSKKRTPRVTSATNIRSRPVTAKGTMPAPDAEVFLARAIQVDPQPDTVAVKPTPPVLPPIASGDDINTKVLNRRQQLIRRRLDVNTQPEYSKLAVGKVATSSNTWVHEPNAATK